MAIIYMEKMALIVFFAIALLVAGCTGKNIVGKNVDGLDGTHSAYCDDGFCDDMEERGEDYCPEDCGFLEQK